MSNYLIHYASQYYDPQKAHEYYEEHKKLTGRTSTAGLNEEGRKVASYVRKQIYDERDSKIGEKRTAKDANIKSSSEQKDSRINSARNNRDAQIANHRNQMNSQIESLRVRLSNMTKAQKVANKDQIYAQIDALKQAQSKFRESMNTDFTNFRTSQVDEHRKNSENLRTQFKSDREALREEATSKYSNELTKLKSEAAYASTRKSSK